MTTKPTVPEKLISRLKSYRAVAVVLALGSAIIALATFTDAAKSLVGLFHSAPSAESARASLAGMSMPYTPEAFVKAAADGDVTAIRLFLAAGIDPNTPAFLETRAEHLPALASAAFESHADVVEILLKAHAKIVTPEYNSLIAAALSDNVAILRRMLRQGATLDAMEEAFVLAERRDMLETLEHAGVDVKKNGTTALMQATSAEAVNFLVERGVDVNARDADGKTVLQHLMDDAFFTSAEAVLALVDHGADINTRDEKGSTLLHRAAHNGNVENARKFLEQKADPTLQDADGRTPLLLAAETGGSRGLKICELLLEHGARVDAAGSDGRTALHLAAERGEVQMVQLLMAHHANPQLADTAGDTPEKLAQRARSPEASTRIVELLHDSSVARP